MAMHRQIRGVGDRSGIFFAGRPTTLLAFDDALVLLQASTPASLLGAQGIAGAAIQVARQHRAEKALNEAGDDLTGAQFADQKRARVIPFGELTSARLEGGRIQRRLTLQTSGGAAHMKYPAKQWPDDDAVAFLGGHLGDRFTNAVG